MCEVRELCMASATPPHVICQLTKTPCRKGTYPIPLSAVVCAPVQPRTSVFTHCRPHSVLPLCCMISVDALLDPASAVNPPAWGLMMVYGLIYHKEPSQRSHSFFQPKHSITNSRLAANSTNISTQKNKEKNPGRQFYWSQTVPNFWTFLFSRTTRWWMCLSLRNYLILYWRWKDGGGWGGSLLCLLLSIRSFYSTQPFDWEADHIFSRF